MKKVLGTLLKIAFFIVAWTVAVKMIPGFLPSYGVEGTGLYALSSELQILIITLVLVVIFWLMDDPDHKMSYLAKPVQGIKNGLLTGMIWAIIAIIVPCSYGGYDLSSIQLIDGFFFWMLALLAEIIIQELVIRGYIYDLIKKNFNIVFAVIVSIIIYYHFAGDVLSGGLIGLLNILSVNLFLCALLEYTQSLWAVVAVRFIWSALGGLIFGALPSVVSTYPHMITISVMKDDLLTGGSGMLEGSGGVFVFNVFLCIIFIVLKKVKGKK